MTPFWLLFSAARQKSADAAKAGARPTEAQVATILIGFW